MVFKLAEAAEDRWRYADGVPLSVVEPRLGAVGSRDGPGSPRFDDQ